jgi:hypothetical protein
MCDLTNYLEYISHIKNLKLYVIIDNIIEKFKYSIDEDTVSNDIRKIILKKNNNKLIISSTIIFNQKLQKMNNITINFNNSNYVLYLDY